MDFEAASPLRKENFDLYLLKIFGPSPVKKIFVDYTFTDEIDQISDEEYQKSPAVYCTPKKQVDPNISRSASADNVSPQYLNESTDDSFVSVSEILNESIPQENWMEKIRNFSFCPPLLSPIPSVDESSTGSDSLNKSPDKRVEFQILKEQLFGFISEDESDIETDTEDKRVSEIQVEKESNVVDPISVKGHKLHEIANQVKERKKEKLAVKKDSKKSAKELEKRTSEVQKRKSSTSTSLPLKKSYEPKTPPLQRRFQKLFGDSPEILPDPIIKTNISLQEPTRKLQENLFEITPTKSKQVKLQKRKNEELLGITPIKENSINSNKGSPDEPIVCPTLKDEVEELFGFISEDESDIETGTEDKRVSESQSIAAMTTEDSFQDCTKERNEEVRTGMEEILTRCVVKETTEVTKATKAEVKSVIMAERLGKKLKCKSGQRISTAFNIDSYTRPVCESVTVAVLPDPIIKTELTSKTQDQSLLRITPTKNKQVNLQKPKNEDLFGFSTKTVCESVTVAGVKGHKLREMASPVKSQVKERKKQRKTVKDCSKKSAKVEELDKQTGEVQKRKSSVSVSIPLKKLSQEQQRTFQKMLGDPPAILPDPIMKTNIPLPELTSKTQEQPLAPTRKLQENIDIKPVYESVTVAGVKGHKFHEMASPVTSPAKERKKQKLTVKEEELEKQTSDVQKRKSSVSVSLPLKKFGESPAILQQEQVPTRKLQQNLFGIAPKKNKQVNEDLFGITPINSNKRLQKTFENLFVDSPATISSPTMIPISHKARLQTKFDELFGISPPKKTRDLFVVKKNCSNYSHSKSLKRKFAELFGESPAKRSRKN